MVTWSNDCSMQWEDNSEILILLLQRRACLTSSELGDSLGSFRHSVLGQLSWQDEADSSLDLAGSHSWLLVVASKVGGFGSDFVKDILQSTPHYRVRHAVPIYGSLAVNNVRWWKSSWWTWPWKRYRYLGALVSTPCRYRSCRSQPATRWPQQQMRGQSVGSLYPPRFDSFSHSTTHSTQNIREIYLWGSLLAGSSLLCHLLGGLQTTRAGISTTPSVTTVSTTPAVTLFNSQTVHASFLFLKDV